MKNFSTRPRADHGDELKPMAGFSLTETVMALAIVSTVALFASTTLVEANVKAKQLNDKTSRAIDMLTLTQTLKSGFAMASIRLQAFVGDPASAHPLSRAVMPLPGKCSDMDSDCPENSAFVWAELEKRGDDVPVLCAVRPRRWIFDASTFNARNYSPTANSVQITHPDGTTSTVSLMRGESIALMAEPVAVLFAINSELTRYDPLYDPATQTYGDVEFDSNPECVANVRDRTQLWAFTVEPVLLPNTGTTVPSTAVVREAIGKFPARIRPASLHVIGRSPSTAAPGPALEIRRCQRKNATSPWACSEIEPIAPIAAVDLAMTFAAPPEMGMKAVPRGFISSNCSGADCVAMLYPTAQVPYFVSGENWSTLQPNEFSLFKLQYLSAVAIRLTYRKDFQGRTPKPERLYVPIL